MSWEPSMPYSKTLHIVHRGRMYKRVINGLWYQEYATDRPDRLIGHSLSLDKAARRFK